MDLFPGLPRCEYESLDGGLDTSLFESGYLLGSKLRWVYPHLERYIHLSLCRFAAAMPVHRDDLGRVETLMKPVQQTSIIAALSVRKAAWRELLPEHGRSGTLLTKCNGPLPKDDSDTPQTDEMVEHFEREFPGLEALIPRSRDFVDDGPFCIDSRRLDGLSPEQTLDKDDIRHALYMALEPQFLDPFPRLTRFIDERAWRVCRGFRRRGATGSIAALIYQFAQLQPTIAAGTTLHLIQKAFSTTEPVDR